MIEVLVLECFHCAKVKAGRTVNCTTITRIFQYTSRALFVACIEWCIACKQAPSKNKKKHMKLKPNSFFALAGRQARWCTLAYKGRLIL